MAFYILTDWEINGYNDSDFMCSFYDEEQDKIRFFEYGTTRFYAPTTISFNNGISSVVVDGQALKLPTKEIVEKARLALATAIFDRLKKTEERNVFTPDVEILSAGLSVTLTSKAKMKVKSLESCQKCLGSGHWINPRNSEDKRKCFTCGGAGQVKGTNIAKDGKQVWEQLPAGLFGTVIDWHSFGKFYANGHNKPNRDNTTVRFDNGGKVYSASLKKLKLTRDPMSDSELMKRADSYSHDLGFSSLYPRHAWDTHNFAANVLKGAG